MLTSLKLEMGITKDITIYLCKSVGSPMMIGLFKPRIFLSTLEPAQDELSFILKHELVHYKRKDLLYKYLVLAATALHWFNPIVYLMAKAIYALCETSCDAEVLRSADEDTRQFYGETIIGVVKYQSKLKTALSTNFYGGRKGMKNRILSIMDTRKKRAGVILAAVVLILVIGTGSVFAANRNGSYRDFDFNDQSPEEALDSAMEEWHEWYNSLAPEEQEAVSFRPPNFEYSEIHEPASAPLPPRLSPEHGTEPMPVPANAEILTAYNELLALSETDANIRAIQVLHGGEGIWVVVDDENVEVYSQQLYERFGAIVTVSNGAGGARAPSFVDATPPFMSVSPDVVLAAYNEILALAETDERILEVRLHPNGERVFVAVTEEAAMERSREFIRQISEQFGSFVMIMTGDIDEALNAVSGGMRW